jgi:hypothetical protein
MAMEAKGDQLVHEVRTPPTRHRHPCSPHSLTNPLLPPSLVPSTPQAEQALKKWSFFGGNDKYEDAAEKLQRAGHAYKAAKACALLLPPKGGRRTEPGALRTAPKGGRGGQQRETLKLTRTPRPPAFPVSLSRLLSHRRGLRRRRVPQGRRELRECSATPPPPPSPPPLPSSSHPPTPLPFPRPLYSPRVRVVQKKAKSDSDIATCYIESSRCFIKAGDAKTATELLENEALPRMVDAGRLSQAAKLHQEVAEMFEDEGQLEDAMSNYQKAADLFNAENAASTASKCLGKIALLAAQVRETRGRGRERERGQGGRGKEVGRIACACGLLWGA